MSAIARIRKLARQPSKDEQSRQLGEWTVPVLPSDLRKLLRQLDASYAEPSDVSDSLFPLQPLELAFAR